MAIATGFWASGLDKALAQATASTTPSSEPVATMSSASPFMFAAIIGGVSLVALIAAIGYMKTRRSLHAERKSHNHMLTAVQQQMQDAQVWLQAEDHILIQWPDADRPPCITGNLPGHAAVPSERTEIPAFGKWLKPESAHLLEKHLAALRERGEAFTLSLTTVQETYLEATGRTSNGAALMRLRDLSADRQQLAQLYEKYEDLRKNVQTVQTLMERSPMPVWLRDEDGKLSWVNAAYVAAVDGTDHKEVLGKQSELLEADGRQAIQAGQAEEGLFQADLPAIVSGERHVLSVVDVKSAGGSAGMAADVTAISNTEAELKRTIDFHAKTLDQLATPVMIFGPDQALQFFNEAAHQLWQIELSWLEQNPSHQAFLDRLREESKLPVEVDYKGWKARQLETYRAVEPREDYWHLPNGQTIRVLASPHAQGGVTLVFENLTDRLELEGRYKTLTHVQGETLDNLSDGVAVFASDGNLTLANPAFALLWGFDKADLANNPHIDQLMAHHADSEADQMTWAGLKMRVTGVSETRESLAGRLQRDNGNVLDYATIPLPDGATLATFIDVTEKEKYQRALEEKNEALETAGRLKNDFIQHVSYELRSPLTNIIGFMQLLNDETTGPLNEKQQEYMGYVSGSSAALLAIINDILDLATLDAGTMGLDLSEVDIHQTILGAAEGVQDRLQEQDQKLAVTMPKEVGAFVADEKRIRQILFNLLSNAIHFSERGSTIKLVCRRAKGQVRFDVMDQGCGIPQDLLDKVFERFESHNGKPGANGGAGLGLSIVKSLVELHKGSVHIQSSEGEGTIVSCLFPDNLTIPATPVDQ